MWLFFQVLLLCFVKSQSRENRIRKTNNSYGSSQPSSVQLHRKDKHQQLQKVWFIVFWINLFVQVHVNVMSFLSCALCAEL